MSEVPVAPSVLELLMVMLDAQTYPHATIEVTIESLGQWANDICMCRECLEAQRSMMNSYARRPYYSDTQNYLIYLSEGTGIGIVRRLHPHGEAKCSQCVIRKQGRLPR